MTGKQLKTALEELGLTQAQFAAECGTSARSVRRWVRSKSIPKLVMIAVDYLKQKRNE